MSTQPRCAIVTGASGGIGSIVVQRLAATGVAVVANYSGNPALAEELVRKVEAAGGKAVAVMADVSRAADVAALFDAAETAFGGVDILVNTAGIMKLAPLAECDDELVDRHLAVNLKGTINTMREAARRLRDGGRIVNFSSSVVGLYQPTYGIYAATKAGVEAMTNVFAKEMRGRRITVNAVAPGPTDTPLFTDGNTPEQIATIARMGPMERLGEPVDIANAVAFLAGPDGAWVNGQILRVNGGVI